MITNELERHIRRREGFIVHPCAGKLNSLVRCELKSTIVVQADSDATTDGNISPHHKQQWKE
jgi:hypothetical protein